MERPNKPDEKWAYVDPLEVLTSSPSPQRKAGKYLVDL